MAPESQNNGTRRDLTLHGNGWLTTHIWFPRQRTRDAVFPVEYIGGTELFKYYLPECNIM